MKPEPAAYWVRMFETFEYALAHPYGVTIDDVMQLTGMRRQAASQYLKNLERIGWLEAEWRDYTDCSYYTPRRALKSWRIPPAKLAQISEAAQPIRSAMRLVRGGER